VFRLTLAVLLALVSSSLVFASVEYDQNVTPNVIFAGGIENGGFTVDRASGLELGLRAVSSLLFTSNGINSNGDGTYRYFAGSEAGHPLWHFDWSINTSWDGTTSLRFLRDLKYELRIDVDPGISTSFYTLDPVNGPNPNGTLWDHAIGDQFTTVGGGTVASDQSLYAGLIAGKNVAQNSWQFDQFPVVFDPFVAGVYTIELAAFPKSAPNSSAIALTSIDVIVERTVDDSQHAPEPLSFLTWGGLIGCAVFAARRQQR
jgi:hypothetical protein